MPRYLINVLQMFKNLPPTVDQTSLEQQLRDPIQYWMHNINPSVFPRGSALIPINQVFRVILDADQPLCSTWLVREACSSHRIRNSSPRIYPPLGDTLITRTMDLSEWISTLFPAEVPSPPQRRALSAVCHVVNRATDSVV